MPVRLVDKRTGVDTFVDESELPSALASGRFLQPAAVAAHVGVEGDTYVAPGQIMGGSPLVTPIDPAQAGAAAGAEIIRSRNSGLGGMAKAAVGSFIGGTTLGAWDPWKEAQEAQPIAAGVGTAASFIAPFLIPGGEAAKASEFLGESTAAEHIAGSLSSKALHAGETRAGASALETSMIKGNGKRLAGELAEEGGATGRLAEGAEKQIARMGPRELEAAKGAEVARIQATRAAEAKQIVTDLGEHRAAYMNDDRIWLAMKADDAKAIGDISEVSAMASKADKRIRGMLNNPKELVRKPEQMLSALTQQETALEHLAANEPALRTAFAADESGTRAAALDRLPAALERNRALQERLGAIIGPEKSPILDAIEAAKAPRKEGIAAQLLGGKVFHVAEQAFGAVPFVGPMIGAKAAELAKSLLFGHGATAVKDGMATAARVAKDFVSKAIRGPGAPVVASRVLADTAFAPVGDKKSAPKTLEKAYERRSAELRSQTAYDATGQPKMTPEARAAMAANLAPLRMASPVLADRVETVAAARAEFLSSKLPRCPDGFDPKRWKASDMEMRTFARYVDAADHPEHVERRIVDGTISPEDAEAYRAVYPQRHAAMVSQLVQEMSQSKTPVPYMRRLSLSVFSGVPCDPSFEPSTIAALQGHFAKEHGSQGGTANPSPQAQFGSVKKSAPEPTPADKRSQGG